MQGGDRKQLKLFAGIVRWFPELFGWTDFSRIRFTLAVSVRPPQKPRADSHGLVAGRAVYHLTLPVLSLHLFSAEWTGCPMHSQCLLFA